jgi:hypothetical protein
MYVHFHKGKFYNKFYKWFQSLTRKKEGFKMRKLIVVGCLLVSVLVAGLISDNPALAETKKVLIAGGRATSPWLPFVKHWPSS